MTTKPIDYSEIIDIVLSSLFSAETILVIVFVILTVSAIRLFTPNMKNEHYKWFALLMSLVGTLLIKEFAVNKKFLFDFLMMLSLSTLVYLYLGKQVLNKWIEKAQVKLGLTPDTVTVIEKKTETPTTTIEQQTVITDKPISEIKQ